MDENTPKRFRRVYSSDSQGNTIFKSRRIGETNENSDSDVEQVNKATSVVGPSVNACESDTSLSSTDTLKDADDLLNELDSMLASTSKGNTGHATQDNQVEKKISFETDGMNGAGHHENSDENTATASIDNRTKNLSDTNVDIEEIVKVSQEIQEEISQTKVLKAHDLNENIIDTAYGSETDITTAGPYSIEPHSPIVSIKDNVLDEKAKDSKAVDLTQILQTVKTNACLEYETIRENINIDKSVRKASTIVVSIPSVVMVTSGNENVAPTLPGEVSKASYKRKKEIVEKHTEIDNYDVGEIRKKKRKTKTLKKMFCGCVGEKRETEVQSVCYGMRQAEEGMSAVKKEEVVYDKVEYLNIETKRDDEFLHFEAFNEDKDSCFRRMWKRVRGCI